MQAFEELARRPAAVLDMRNFIAAAGMFYAVIASAAQHQGLVVHANAAARTLLLHLGFPQAAFRDEV